MAPRTSTKKVVKPKVSKAVFTYFAPEANEVCVAGSFNAWSEKEFFLKKNKSGQWKISIPLPAGRYEYRFLVDGNWSNSQDQVESVPNSYGTWNSVLQVEA